MVSLARRPVLFALARALGEAWPGDVPRAALVARAFGGSAPMNRTARACASKSDGFARVLRTLADVNATKRGFVLAPRRVREIVVLARPVDEEHAAVLALLADGESWSSSALALALEPASARSSGPSTRSRPRARCSRSAAGRARRWMTPPVPGFATTLLLPTSLPTD